MATGLWLALLLPFSVLLAGAKLPPPQKHEETLAVAAGAVDAVLLEECPGGCSVIFLTDGGTSADTLSMVLRQLEAPCTFGLFKTGTVGGDANFTKDHMLEVVDGAQQLRQLSWCVRVVVVSDDPAFLAAFARWSLKGRLLASTSKLLVVTSLTLQQLPDINKTLSTTNAILIILTNHLGSFRCRVYVHLPYSSRGANSLPVAVWTPLEGLTHTTNLPLFPNKFSKFLERPTLVVSSEAFATHRAVMVTDPATPGGKRLTFKGVMAKITDYLSKALNFSYTYVRPRDRKWGAKQNDGSWSGMVGMVVREEADIGLGPFALSAGRAEVVDFTYSVSTGYLKILGARGRSEVDPWGFLLPLAPLVWAAILTTLLLLPATVFLPSSCFSHNISAQGSSLKDGLTFIRVILQQDISVAGNWWWERLVLGVWMMMTLVLTRSYAGNLMSLLAVRHIPQPYHTLRDLVDDPTVKMIWQNNTVNLQYIRSVESGIYREVADAEEERFIYRKIPEFTASLNTLVRPGRHVLLASETILKILVGQDFSKTGNCDFYQSREGFLSTMECLISQKNNLLVPALSKRILGLQEAGLVTQWIKEGVPNSTTCLHIPTKVTVNTSLSVINLWGMFVILAGGHGVSLFFFCLEILMACVHQLDDSPRQDSIDD